MDCEQNVIHLAISDGPASNTNLRAWSGDLDAFEDLLNEPKPGSKDGSYFVRGPFNGTATRADEHITRAFVAILDGDKRIDLETGELYEGAPSPEIVHEAFKDAGVRHLIFTSHSHQDPNRGGPGFHRWRCVVPVELANAEELRAIIDHLIAVLHSQSVMLAPAVENYRWSQAWYFPRLRSPGAPFLLLRYDEGEPLDVAAIVSEYRKRSAADAPKVAIESRPRLNYSGDSPIGRFNAAHGNLEGILDRLERHGYVLKETGTMNGDAAYRLLRPGSTSGEPGVRVFRHRDGSKLLVCSHHGKEDALSGPDGKPLGHDAFDVFRILEAGGDEKQAMRLLRERHPECFGSARKSAPVVDFDPGEPPPWMGGVPAEGDEVPPADVAGEVPASGYESFYAVLPEHKYLHRPTGALWPASSVDSTLPWGKAKVGEKELAVRPSAALDRQRPVHQLTWWPGKPEVINDVVVTSAGMMRHRGVVAYNLYRPPQLPRPGKVSSPDFWRDHLRKIYRNDEEAQHIEFWLAHRAQCPGEKINHALVLCGRQGIGKDALLEPLRAAVGPHNFAEISPDAIVGRFCGWKKSVVLRASEAHDTGDSNRFAIYEASKVLAAAPPEALLVDEKNRQEYYVPNVLGLLFTTNHETSGIYLPPDDRRHFVVTSTVTSDSFSDDYFAKLFWNYGHGGLRAVCDFLLTLDLSGFNAKAPPPKTEAWHAIVAANRDPASQDLAGLLDRLNLDAIALPILHDATARTPAFEIYQDLMSNRRQIPHRLNDCGYSQVRNPSTTQGMWEWKSRKVAVYARKELSLSDQLKAASALVRRHG